MNWCTNSANTGLQLRQQQNKKYTLLPTLQLINIQKNFCSNRLKLSEFLCHQQNFIYLPRTETKLYFQSLIITQYNCLTVTDAVVNWWQANSMLPNSYVQLPIKIFRLCNCPKYTTWVVINNIKFASNNNQLVRQSAKFTPVVNNKLNVAEI